MRGASRPPPAHPRLHGARRAAAATHSSAHTHALPVPRQASTFHASWSPDGSKILFAYRPWDQYGNGIGSQAIGIANADGSGAVPVTYTRNGTDDGALVSDMCPVALTPNGSRMFFTHSPDEGEATFASFVDASAPGATPPTVLAQLPQVAVASGCSNLLPTAAGDTVLYLACFGEGCESPGPAAAADAVAAGAAVGAPRRLRAPATAAAPSAARPHKSTLAHRWGGPVRTAAARRPAVAAAAARTVAGGAAAVAHPAATALPLFGCESRGWEGRWTTCGCTCAVLRCAALAASACSALFACVCLLTARRFVAVSARPDCCSIGSRARASATPRAPSLLPPPLPPPPPRPQTSTCLSLRAATSAPPLQTSCSPLRSSTRRRTWTRTASRRCGAARGQRGTVFGSRGTRGGRGATRDVARLAEACGEARRRSRCPSRRGAPLVTVTRSPPPAAAQCDAIHRAPPGAPLSCQGADTTHNSFQRLFVDRATGNSTTPDYDGFVACMTPRCVRACVLRARRTRGCDAHCFRVGAAPLRAPEGVHFAPADLANCPPCDEVLQVFADVRVTGTGVIPAGASTGGMARRTREAAEPGKASSKRGYVHAWASAALSAARRRQQHTARSFRRWVVAVEIPCVERAFGRCKVAPPLSCRPYAGALVSVGSCS